MKKILRNLAVSALITSSLCFSASANDYKILINNQPLYTSVAPINQSGRILAPLRAIGEAMGCEVIWVAGTQTANLKNDTTIVSMQIGNKKVYI